ncbi:MAG TPA: T9SS type A sorting domain-containing protein [Edaphocola sp.]|nr:T9SS type A sorting domain-containing protein [Edaphocola sp.]
MKPFNIILSFIVFFTTQTYCLWAQEHETVLKENRLLQNYSRPISYLKSKTVLALPFFEDFNQEEYYPNLEKFQDSLVFINKTLGKNTISLGVATLDCFNAKGLPYYPTNPYVTGYADSLTSQYIYLGSAQPSDSIYLSFLFQGGGNGYTPASGDSLMLFFQKSNGSWTKVWSHEGMAMETFQSVIIPLKDTAFLYTDFRFRFVNKATYGVGNSQWHIDYIKLGSQRNFQDTIYNDITFTEWGDAGFNSSLVNEYTAMPIHQFNANRNKYLKSNLSAGIKNNWYTPQSTSVTMTLKHEEGNSSINMALGSMYFQANDQQAAHFTIPHSLISGFNSDPMTLQFKAAINTVGLNDFTQENDTIIHRQIFNNYYAYDDGSAETAYFMNSYQGAPSYVAQEYELEIPDTLRAVQIYFPRQVPGSDYKMFYIQIYKNIDANGTPDSLIYQEEDLYPSYQDMQNGFVSYQFTNDVILPSGTFYVALMFPAGGTSDSIFIGLDKNKKGANFRYFKVENHWQPSLIEGALMIRPVVGKALPVSIPTNKQALNFNVFPNPVTKTLNIELQHSDKAFYSIYSIDGKLIEKNTLIEKYIDIEHLNPGFYFLEVSVAGKGSGLKKFIKK